MSSLSLEKNRLGSIDLTTLAIKVTTAFTIVKLTALNKELLEGFSVQGWQQSLKIFSILSNILELDVFQIGEKFIHQLSAMFTCRNGKAGVLSRQAMKCYIHRGEYKVIVRIAQPIGLLETLCSALELY